MLPIAKLIVFAVSFSAIITSSASELTQDAVTSLISKIDLSISSLNTKTLTETISRDAEIILNVNIQGKKQVVKPSRDEYIEMIKQGWEMYTDYKYNRSNLAIRIDKNRAFVTSDIDESLTTRGQSISGHSKEEIIIEIVEGSPLITKITGYTGM